jgi:hypothetical protein
VTLPPAPRPAPKCGRQRLDEASDVGPDEAARWHQSLRTSAQAWAEAAVIVVLVTTIAYRYLPQMVWRVPSDVIRILRATLVAMPCTLAGGTLLAITGGQGSTAALLGRLLALVLVVYGAIVLSTRIRLPVRIGGDLDVDRSPARVFRELTDLHTPLASGSIARRLEPLDHGPIGVGSRLRERTEDGQERTFVVTDFDPTAIFAYRMDPTSYELRMWYGIEAREGGSRLRWRQRLDVALYRHLRPSYRRFIQGLHAEAAERLTAGRRFADDEVATRP